jgi:hypothetical protein
MDLNALLFGAPLDHERAAAEAGKPASQLDWLMPAENDRLTVEHAICVLVGEEREAFLASELTPAVVRGKRIQALPRLDYLLAAAAQKRPAEELAAFMAAVLRKLVDLDPATWPAALVLETSARTAAAGIEAEAVNTIAFAIVRLKRRFGRLAELVVRLPIDWTEKVLTVNGVPTWTPVILTERRLIANAPLVVATPPRTMDFIVLTLGLALLSDAPARLRLATTAGFATIGDRPITATAVATATFGQAISMATDVAKGVVPILGITSEFVPVAELPDDDREAVLTAPDLVTVTGDPPAEVLEVARAWYGLAEEIEAVTGWRTPWVDAYRETFDRLPPEPPQPPPPPQGNGGGDQPPPSSKQKGGGGSPPSKGDGSPPSKGDGSPPPSSKQKGGGGSPPSKGDGSPPPSSKQKGGGGGSGDKSKPQPQPPQGYGGDGEPQHQPPPSPQSGAARGPATLPESLASKLFGPPSTDGAPDATPQQRAAAAKDVAGKLPGTAVGDALRRLSETLAEPPRGNLADALAEWATQRVALASQDDVTWHRPNLNLLRRHQVWWPARAIPSTGPLAVVVDTSASMGPEHLDAAAAAIQELLVHIAPEVCRIIAADTRWVEVCRLERHDALDLRGLRESWTSVGRNLIGGGGTDMGAVVRGIAADPVDRPELIIVLTDGQTPWCDDPGIPVIVALVEDGPKGPPWARTVVLANEVKRP